MNSSGGSNNQNSDLDQFTPVQSLQKLIFDFEAARKEIDSQKKENGELKNKINVLQREKQQIFESTYHLNLITHQCEIMLEKAMKLFEQIKLEIDPSQRQQFEESFKQISQGVSLDEIEHKVSGNMDEMFPFEKDFQIIVPSSSSSKSSSGNRTSKRLFQNDNSNQENEESHEPPQKKRKLNNHDSPPSSKVGDPITRNLPNIVPRNTNRNTSSNVGGGSSSSTTTSASTIVPPPPSRTPATERTISVTNQNRRSIIPPPQLIFGRGIYIPPKIGIHEWIQRERFRGLPPRSPFPKKLYPKIPPRLTQTIYLDQVRSIFPLNDHLFVLGRLGSLHFYRKNLSQTDHLPVKTFQLYDDPGGVIRSIERHHHYNPPPNNILSQPNQHHHHHHHNLLPQRLLVCGHHPDTYSFDLNKCMITSVFSSPSSFLPIIYPTTTSTNQNNLQYIFKRQEEHNILKSLQPERICNYTAISSSDGRDVYVGGNQSIIQKFDARSPRKIVEYFQGHTQGTSVSHLRLLSGENYLVSSGTDRTIRLWDLRKGCSRRERLEYNEFYMDDGENNNNDNIFFPYLSRNLRRRRSNDGNNNTSRNPYVRDDDDGNNTRISEQEKQALEKIRQTKESRKRVVQNFQKKKKKKKRKKKKKKMLKRKKRRRRKFVGEEEESESEDDEDEDDDEVEEEEENEPPLIIGSSNNDNLLNHKLFFQTSKKKKRKRKKKKKDDDQEVEEDEEDEEVEEIELEEEVEEVRKTKYVERFGETKCFVTKFENVSFSHHPLHSHMINIIGSEGQEFIDMMTCEHSSYNFHFPHNNIHINNNNLSSSSSEEEEEQENNTRKRRKKNGKFYTSIDVEPVFGSWFVCGGLEGQIEFVNFPRGPVFHRFPCFDQQQQEQQKIIDIKLIPSSKNLIHHPSSTDGYFLDMFVATTHSVQKYEIKNDVTLNLRKRN